MPQFDIKSQRTIHESHRIDANSKEEALAIAAKLQADGNLKASYYWVQLVKHETNEPQLLYKLKYWFTGFREILFRAPNENAALDWAERFPENQNEVIKDLSGIEERSEYEIEQVDEIELKK